MNSDNRTWQQVPLPPSHLSGLLFNNFKLYLYSSALRLSVCAHVCATTCVWRLAGSSLLILFYHLPGPVLGFGDRVSCYSDWALTHHMAEDDTDLLLLQLGCRSAGIGPVWSSCPPKVLRRVDLCPHSELLSLRSCVQWWGKKNDPKFEASLCYILSTRPVCSKGKQGWICPGPRRFHTGVALGAVPQLLWGALGSSRWGGGNLVLVEMCLVCSGHSSSCWWCSQKSSVS